MVAVVVATYDGYYISDVIPSDIFATQYAFGAVRSPLL
jgi:hypothetical protein